MKIEFQSHRVPAGMWKELLEAARLVLKETSMDEWSESLEVLESVVAKLEVIHDGV